MRDPSTGALRKTWAFVMVLAYSRHQYVEFVFDQALPTWIQLHGHAFTFFGGVPQRVVLDHHRQPLDCRVERRPFGHRPALKRAVQLQPEVVMQVRRVVCVRALGVGLLIVGSGRAHALPYRRLTIGRAVAWRNGEIETQFRGEIGRVEM